MQKFFRAFLSDPRTTGSIIESSPFLIKKMLKPINFEKAEIIVELGAGTGVITKKILKKMGPNTSLLCFETNKVLAKELKRKNKDSRLKVYSDSAENFGRYLKRFGKDKADYVVSGLPLVVLPKKIADKIIKEILENLHPKGVYVQFQYSLTSRKLFKKLFGQVKIDFTPANIPPAFVYSCKLGKK